MVGYVPDLIRDIPSWIWDMVTFRTWIFKSEIPIWDVRNQTSDLVMSQIKFGTKLRLVYNRSILNFFKYNEDYYI